MFRALTIVNTDRDHAVVAGALEAELLEFLEVGGDLPGRRSRKAPMLRSFRCKAPSHLGDTGERNVANFAGGKRDCGGTEGRREGALHPPWKPRTARIDRGLMIARKSHKCDKT